LGRRRHTWCCTIHLWSGVLSLLLFVAIVLRNLLHAFHAAGAGFCWLNLSALITVRGDANVPSVTPVSNLAPMESVISANVIAWRYLRHALILSIVLWG
jgi:hypothetical protein